MTNQSKEKFQLSWLCQLTGKKIPAGVAYYSGKHGDFELRVDALFENLPLYLKATSMHEDKIFYRVEKICRKGPQGRFVHRADIGSGSANASDGLPITMDIGPYSKILVLEEMK